MYLQISKLKISKLKNPIIKYINIGYLKNIGNMITYLFYILFIVIYIFFIPGYLIAKKYTHKTDRLTHFTLSISLSITIIPVISFILALVFRTYVSQLIIILAATIINLIFIGNLIVKPKKEK